MTNSGVAPDKYALATNLTAPAWLILYGALDNNIPVSNAQQLVELCAMKQLIVLTISIRISNMVSQIMPWAMLNGEPCASSRSTK